MILAIYQKTKSIRFLILLSLTRTKLSAYRAKAKNNKKPNKIIYKSKRRKNTSQYFKKATLILQIRIIFRKLKSLRFKSRILLIKLAKKMAKCKLQIQICRREYLITNRSKYAGFRTIKCKNNSLKYKIRALWFKILTMASMEILIITSRYIKIASCLIRIKLEANRVRFLFNNNHFIRRSQFISIHNNHIRQTNIIFATIYS